MAIPRRLPWPFAHRHRLRPTDCASRRERLGLQTRTEAAVMILRRLRSVIDPEQSLQQGRLFIAAVGFDTVGNSQRANDGHGA